LFQELEPKIIKTPNFEYEFDHACKNEKWHPLEPISLDLQKAASIHNKANRWIGNVAILRKSGELGKVYFLVGKSHSSSIDVQEAYQNAITNMRYGIENIEIFEDDHAEEFASKLAGEIAAHKKETSNK
jgi:hypothetical protein